MRFGSFVFDLSNRELLKDGRPVALKALAAKALVVLVARPGRLVTRQALIEALWPDTRVDYDQGLNNTIRQLRHALGDDATSPRFIETVPRQGYRFIARLSEAPPGAEGVPSSWVPPSPEVAPARGRSVRASWLWAASALLLAMALVLALRLDAPETAASPLTVAVLPFSGPSRDLTMLGSDLAKELSRELTAVAGYPLHVVGFGSAVLASREAGSVRAAGQRVGATHVVTGALRSDGAEFHLSLILVRVADGETLWRDAASSSWPDLLAEQRRLALELGARVAPER